MNRKLKIVAVSAVLLISAVFGVSGLSGGKDELLYEDAEGLPGETGAAFEDVRIKEDEAEPLRDIYVHVCGAVAREGVYKLPEGSRVFEAVEMAGGFAEDAVKEYLNLASVLSDGMKLYVPTDEELSELSVINSAEESTSSLININTASREQLMSITGIGETRALAIIEYREKNGAFSAIEDIMKVDGIKQGMFDKIKDQITV